MSISNSSVTTASGLDKSANGSNLIEIPLLNGDFEATKLKSDFP